MNQFKRPFGKSKEVSLFTLGTMRVNSFESMYSILKEACMIGINHIETSSAYGSTQKFLGDALKELSHQKICPKGGWVITSKLLPGISFSEGQRQIEEMILNIGLSNIDNLAVHGLNLSEHLDWSLNGDGFKLFQWAYKKNLVTQFGFTSHGSKSLIKAAIEDSLFNFCSLHVHLLDQSKLKLAKQALKLGMGVMAISPADKGGHLYSPSQALKQDCYPIPPLILAYRFLLSQGISTLTLGASKREDLAVAKELIATGDPLTLVEQTSINQLEEKRKIRLGETYCGQCQRCLPCPNNIPIPEILRLRNLSIGHELDSFARERYNLIGRAGHWWEQVDARACEKCGECIPRCPNNLEIPDLLKETHNKLIDKPTRRLWS